MIPLPAPRLSPKPLSRNGAFTIITVSTMHIVQAVIVLFNAQAARATPLMSLVQLMHKIYPPDGTHLLALVMCLSAVMAFLGAVLSMDGMRLSLFLPQNFILGVMAFGGLQATLDHQYLDGTVIPWAHIFVDQLGMTVLFVIHSGAILRRAEDPHG